jgi:hypothetical protein
MSRYLLGVALAQVEPPRRRRRHRFLVLPVAIALGALVLSAAAEARTAKFRVSIEGKQRVKWQEHKVDTGTCSSITKGSGFETVRFRSRPAVLTATDYGSMVAWRHRRRAASLVARGKVTRRGSSTLTPTFPPDRKECYGTPCSELNPCDGSWTPPPAPDCGTKRFTHYRLGLRGWLKDRLIVEDEQPSPLGFANCTWRGPAFPELMSMANGKLISAHFPRAEIFDESLGKELVIGRASVPLRAGAGVTGRSSVEWTLEFVRLR